MRNIISNTTPILSLLKVDKLDVLQKMYGKIIVPSAVYQEIERGSNKPYYQDIKWFDWIDIRQVTHPDSLTYFVDLDVGEAEVLLLSKEINADLVIIDEIVGRRYAKQLNLKITGTLGVLLKAKKLGLIPSVKDLISEMQEKGSWFSTKLVSRLLELADENK